MDQPVGQYLGNLEPVYRQSRVMCCDLESWWCHQRGQATTVSLRDVDICNDQNVSQPTVKRCRLSLHYTVESVSQTNSALKEKISVNLPMSNGDQIVDQFFYPQLRNWWEERLPFVGVLALPVSSATLSALLRLRYDLQ